MRLPLLTLVLGIVLAVTTTFGQRSFPERNADIPNPALLAEDDDYDVRIKYPRPHTAIILENFRERPPARYLVAEVAGEYKTAKGFMSIDSIDTHRFRNRIIVDSRFLQTEALLLGSKIQPTIFAPSVRVLRVYWTDTRPSLRF